MSTERKRRRVSTRRFQVYVAWDAKDGVWVTYVPDLGFLSTFGETREEAFANTKEAIVGYLEAAAKEGLPDPWKLPPPEVVDIEVAVP